MKSIHAFLFVLSAAVVPATAASANHHSPLHAATCEYRDAVKKFECAVRDARFIDPCDVRLVSRLADAACAMHHASGHPELVDRVLFNFNELNYLHRRVAAAIFGRSCYPQDPVLVQCWQRVSCAFRDLAKQVECICGEHRALRPAVGVSGTTTYGLPRSIFPHAAFPGLAIPPAAVPYGSVPRTTIPPAAIPHATIPRAIPPASYPGATLPREFAPTNPRVDPRAGPEFAPRQPGPAADEIRYFGRRNLHPSSLDRYNVDAHYTRHDLRSALIGAMLSRLAR